MRARPGIRRPSSAQRLYKSRVHVPNSPRSPTSSDRGPRAQTNVGAKLTTAATKGKQRRQMCRTVRGGRARMRRLAATVVELPPLQQRRRHAKKMPEPDPEAPLREAREACGGVRASTKRVTLECPICWQDVAKTSAGLSQHQFWSELCNTYLCLAEF